MGIHMFVCVGRGFLIQSFAFHSLVVVNNAVLEICEVFPRVLFNLTVPEYNSARPHPTGGVPSDF